MQGQMFQRRHPGAATAFGVPAYARSGRNARKAMRIRLSNGLLMPRLLGVESIAKNRKSQTALGLCAHTLTHNSLSMFCRLCACPEAMILQLFAMPSAVKRRECGRVCAL